MPKAAPNPASLHTHTKNTCKHKNSMWLKRSIVSRLGHLLWKDISKCGAQEWNNSFPFCFRGGPYFCVPPQTVQSTLSCYSQHQSDQEGYLHVVFARLHGWSQCERGEKESRGPDILPYLLILFSLLFQHLLQGIWSCRLDCFHSSLKLFLNTQIKKMFS